MTFKKFDLTVDNPSGIYYSGQLVTGKVLIDTSKDRPIDSISLHITGEAAVYWAENEGKREGKRTVHYQNREQYFSQNFLLLGYNRGFVVRSGSHVFPFKFQLPQNLPSSFEGEHGHIRYKMRCTVQKSSKRKPHITHKDLSIISLFNLNIVTGASVSVFTSNCIQVPGDASTKPGSVNICISTLKSGFVPGETILANLEIRNSTPRIVKKIALQLVSMETYKAKLRSTICRKVLSITRYENCRIYPAQFLTWNDVCLVVPQRLPPSGLPCCSVIEIKYVLEVVLKPSGSSPLVISCCNVILGTIPLKQKFPAMRRSRTYEKLCSSSEEIDEGVSQGRVRSKSISCRADVAVVKDVQEMKKPLERLKYTSEPHVGKGKSSVAKDVSRVGMGLKARKDGRSGFSSEGEINKRGLSHSGNNINYNSSNNSSSNNKNNSKNGSKSNNNNKNNNSNSNSNNNNNNQNSSNNNNNSKNKNNNKNSSSSCVVPPRRPTRSTSDYFTQPECSCPSETPAPPRPSKTIGICSSSSPSETPAPPRPSKTIGISSSSSPSEGLYDRYSRRREGEEGGEKGWDSRRKGAEKGLKRGSDGPGVKGWERGSDGPGYVTIAEREEESEILRVLESGTWDEETFTRLLMS